MSQLSFLLCLNIQLTLKLSNFRETKNDGMLIGLWKAKVYWQSRIAIGLSVSVPPVREICEGQTSKGM